MIAAYAESVNEMNILVAYASKHGSTREIAEAITTELRNAGLNAEIHDAEDVSTLDGFSAIVLGSAIYVGQWQRGATDFIDRNLDQLRLVPVWLFSSGPIGEVPFPAEDPPATADLISKTGALGYRNFLGKLDRADLALGERLITKVLRAPEGDFRNWDEIREWAQEIANALGAGLARVRETA